MSGFPINLKRCALTIATLLIAATLHAHEIRPTIVDLVINNQGVYQLQLETNLEALIAGIGPEHSDTENAPEAVRYNALRALSPEALQQELDRFLPTLLSGFTLDADEEALSPALAGTDIPGVGDTTLARDSRLLFQGQLPQNTATLDWTWSSEFGANAIRVTGPGNTDIYTGYLTQGQSSGPIDVTDVVRAGSPVWLWYIPVLILGVLWVIVTIRSRKKA